MTNEEAIAILEAEAEYLYSQDEPYNWLAFKKAIEALKAEPKRGRWIYLYAGGYKCSSCGAWWTFDETPFECGMDYCPSCGAKMDIE